MSNIGDLPDNPKFTIKAVSSQTGIRPVTLRAWERRHDVLTPHRSDNKYRLYSERDVAILRWLKNRIDSGVAISSAVAEMRGMLRNNIWPDAVPSAPTLLPRQNDIPPQEYAQMLYEALIRHDETAAGDLVREIQTSFDVTTIFTQIFTPALVQIGEDWYTGKIRIATEHFASAYLRGKLLAMFQAYPTRRNSAYIIIGCAETEQHEIGSLMMSVLLRAQGYRVEYLGPDIPLEDLVDYAKFERPAMVILSASLESSSGLLRKAQEKLARVKGQVIFGYGGGAFVRQPELRKMVPGEYLGDTLDGAVNRVRELVKGR